MRPVSLEIAGLHSFRKRRVIDFAPLLQDNLFGIFGPTGSGKSTILDGITLALFGKIERTSKNKRSFINLKEEECVVAFTFDIEYEGQREQYRAERLFKRNKTGGIETKRVRLIRAREEEITLAEKESEVTSLLEQILGMQDADFRLAVVLPQGAFAQFLHMKYAERGQMLQRIFGIEMLGQQLNDSLKQTYNHVRSLREKIEERLNHLQAYNDDALRESRNNVQTVSEQLKQTRQELASAEKEYREAEELYSLIAELNSLSAGKEERARAALELDSAKKTIALAERCLALDSIIAKTADAVARHESARNEEEKTLREKKARETALAPLTKRKEWADEQRNPEDGKMSALIIRADVLKQAADREERIARLKKDYAERQANLTTKQEEKKRIAKREAETRALEENATRRRKELEDRAEETAQKYDTLFRSEASISILERLASQKKEDAATLQNIRQHLTTLSTRKKEEATALQKELELQNKQEKALQDLRSQYDQARLGRALADAVENLEEGKPCPLCGAEHHPHPFHPETDTTAGIAARITQTEKSLKDLSAHIRTLEKQEAALDTDLKNAGVQQNDLEERIRRADEEIRKAVEQSGYKGRTDHQTLLDWKDRIGPRLKEAGEARKKAAEELKDHERAVKNAAEERTRILSEAAGLQSTIEAQEKELERLQKEQQEESAIFAELLAKINMSPESVSQQNAATLLQETIAEKERLEKEIAEIEQNFATAREKFNEAVTRHNLHAATLEREEKARKQLEAEREERLKEEGFDSLTEWESGYLDPEELSALRIRTTRMENEIREAEQRIAELNRRIDGRTITEEQRNTIRSRFTETEQKHEANISLLGAAESALRTCETKNSEWKKAEEENRETLREFRAAEKLSGYLRGNAFINFLADERLQYICRIASAQLLDLTGGRLEVGTTAEEGFYIKDNGNAGLHRPPSTLSGGETFLVSLALSLALSDSLRVGRAPLEFFFLDEGFGTLDSELLETVMDSVERIRLSSRRAIGVISHVRELQERIPRRLVITSATEVNGSDIKLEIA